jgi:Tol biopolymer transport system component/imidazolonepropionase-like amidohydrolase
MYRNHSTWRWAALMLAALLVLSTSPVLAKGKKAKGEDADSQNEEERWDVSDPPGNWHPVKIDTTETTWSNVDVSPDGRTIVFDMLGDLYTVPMEGGEATPLTDGIEWNYQPRYSPDGKKIAFITDRGGGDNLWIMGADGSDPKAVTEEKEHLVHNPYWSPDGDYIVAKKSFMSTRSIPAGEIWMFHAGGGGGLQLTDRPHGPRDQKNMAEPAYSTDGRHVFYSQDTTSGRVWQYNKDSTGQLFVIKRLDLEKGETDVLVGGPGGALRPTPSPDGKYLAFVKRIQDLTSALYLMDLTSGKKWAIHQQMERDLQESSGSEGNTPAFAWTPDSASIVFWAQGKLHRIAVETREVREIRVHVTAEKKIQAALRFPVDVAPDRFRVRMPRWLQKSPTDDTIVFQTLGHIYVTAPGAEPKRLTSQDDHFEFWPSFSRDGRWIAYTTWSDQELGSVRIVSVRGGESRVLTPQPGHYVEPSFSPDGSTVAYRKFSGGYLLSPLWSLESGIYVVSSRGGEPTRVSRSGYDAQFGAGNDRVFFSTSAGEGKLELKSVDTAGQEERTHLTGDQVTEFRIAPNGRWVAFTEHYNAFVAPFAATGRSVDISSGTKSLPVRQVSKRSGEFLHWSGASDELHWSHGPTLYTRDLKDAFSFLDGSPPELPDPVAEGFELSFEVESDRPAGSIALTGARVVTMRDAHDTREVIENGVVLVEGNRIAAVGKVGEVRIPEGAFTFDVSGKTIVPGLVDAHAHGWMARSEITPEQNWIQFSNLAFGVTTIHDPSNDTTEIFAAAEMQRAGAILGPRIYSTGTILYGARGPGYHVKVDGLEDAEFHVRRLKEVGAISVKSYQLPRRDQRQQIVNAARELEMMVVPEGGMKFQHNMNEIVDGHTGIEHSLPIKTGYDDVVQLWSQTRVGYTPTFVVAFGGLSGEEYWYDRTNVWENERLMRYCPRFIIEPRAIRRSTAPDSHYNHVEVARFAKTLIDSGVSVHIGAHGQREGLAAHWEMWMMGQGGFTPWEAIRSGTISGAWYLGLDGDLGSLEPGKLADLVVIDGNPLEDLRRTEYVDFTMINGRLYETATMNQVAPDKTERQPFYFELEGGDTIPAATVGWLEQLQRHGSCAH